MGVLGLPGPGGVLGLPGPGVEEPRRFRSELLPLHVFSE